METLNTMTLHLEYITDGSGKPKSVVIPRKEWDFIQNDYMQMKNKLAVLLGLRDAMKEVREIQRGKRKAKSLSDFLNEQ